MAENVFRIGFLKFAARKRIKSGHIRLILAESVQGEVIGMLVSPRRAWPFVVVGASVGKALHGVAAPVRVDESGWINILKQALNGGVNIE